MQARDIAREMLGAVRKDSDPSTFRKRNRAAPDVEALGRRYFIEYGDRRHKPRYFREQKRMLETKVIPALGKTKVASVTHDDVVVALHNGLMATPFEANRVLSLVRGIFKHAILSGLRRDGANPCQHVRKFREWKRDRLLTDDEVRHPHQTLDDAEHEAPNIPAASSLCASCLEQLAASASSLPRQKLNADMITAAPCDAGLYRTGIG